MAARMLGDVVIGQVLLGKYRVERLLGQGGMGVVVEATHLELGQRVALKFLLPEALAIDEIRGRFLREARAAARLRSEHVARVLDVGTSEGGSPFIVMEMLEGEDLSSVVLRRGRLPIELAAAWILEACEAIAEAHSLGIIHRDLKPSNLFLARGPGRSETIKVLDFGIAKVSAADGLDPALTRTVAILGSPGYASPEQLRATRDVDLRTDIWALGVTLYQLVSGGPPWDATTIPELSIKIAMDPTPPLPPALGVPAALEAVIRRCLEKDPARRFPDVASLAAALMPFAAGGRSAVERVRRAGGTIQTTADVLKVPHPRERSWRRAMAAMLVASAALAGGLTAAATRGRAAEPGLADAGGQVDAGRQVDAGAPDADAMADAADGGAPPADARQAAPEDAATAPDRVAPTEDDRYLALLEQARQRPCASATALYGQAIDLRPRRHEALAGMGACLLERGDYDRAIGNFRAALAISGRDPSALIGAADAYRRKGNTPAAILHYRRYLAAAPRGEQAARARRNLQLLSDESLFGDGSR